MTVSAEVTGELIESMARGSQELSSLINLTERERSALVSSNHEAFAACTEEKQQALAEFVRRQNEIIAVLRRAGDELGMAAGEITVSVIRESIPQPRRERLSSLAREIGRRLTQLQDANARNTALLKNALAYFDFLANLIIEAFSERPEYGPRTKTDNTRPMMMDKRA